MPEEEGNCVLFLQHSGPLRDTVQEESRTTPVPGKKKWRASSFKLEGAPSHSLNQMGQQSKAQPVTKTIRKDIDKSSGRNTDQTKSSTKRDTDRTGSSANRDTDKKGSRTNKDCK